MNIDDYDLEALWQRQQPPRALTQAIRTTVERHRRTIALRRWTELALTIAGVAVLAWPSGADGLSPRQWLLIPFFAVYLPLGWAIVLRQRQVARHLVTERVAAYVHLRQRQLRHVLCNLCLADRAAGALLAYAVLASAVTILGGTAAWRDAAGTLLVWSVLWYAGTRWLTSRRRRKALREYRALLRLSGSGRSENRRPAFRS